MSKYNFLKNNFLGGEISPRAYGRAELDIYRSTCEELTNVVVYPQGGVSRRPGSEFIASQVVEFLPSPVLTDMTVKHRIIPYIRSKTEAYCILIRANTNSSAYTSGTNCDIFSTRVSSSDSSECWRGNTSFGGSNAKIKLSFLECSWIENFGGVSAIPNAKQFAGYSETQLDDLKYTTFGDFIVLMHPEVPPVFIQFIGGLSDFVVYPFYLTPTFFALGLGSSSVDSVAYAKGNWPFRAINANASHTLSFSSTSGTVTVTSSKNYFESSLIGAQFLLSAGGWFEITGVTNATSATASVLEVLASAAATANWYESSWSDARGWPRCGTYHQGRLIFGGNVSEPQTLWGSKINDIHTFYTGATTATDPINLPIDSDDINEIQWLVSGKNLDIGTGGREYISFPRDSTEALSTTNITFSAESASGSAYVSPVRVGNAVTFIDRDYRTVREFVFNFQEDSFKSDALSVLSEHMPFKSAKVHEDIDDPKIIRMAWQSGQNSCMWYVDNNGGLFANTRIRELQVNAWHSHQMGGTLQDEPCKVEDVCVLPNRHGTHDDVWLIVKRTIDGVDVRMVERITQQFRRDSLDYNPSGTETADGLPTYLDSQWTMDTILEVGNTTPRTEFSYFEHLIGETVDIIGDGKYMGQVEVQSDGTITLPETALRSIAGLPYRSIITPSVLEAGSQIGSGQTAIQRIDQVQIRFERTVAAKFGRDLDNLEDIIFRENSVAMDSYTPLFTGVKVQEVRGVYDRANKVSIVCDMPLPFSVASISFRGTTYD